VPALLELAPMLVLIATFLLCFLTMQGYRFSLRPLLEGVAWIVQHFAVHIPGIGAIGPGPWLARQIKALDRIIMTALAYGIDRSEDAIVGLWNGSAALSEWIAREIAGVAHDAAGAVERLGSAGLRRLSKGLRRLIDIAVAQTYRRLLKIVGHLTHGLGKRIIAAVGAIVGLQHLLKAWRGYTAKQLRLALRRLARLGWLAGVGSLAALGHLIFKKLGLRWLIGHKTLAALGLAIIAKLGLGWLRCNNVNNLGKRACGLDTDLFDLLLLDTVAILGGISVVEFARELQSLEGEAIGIMRAGIREL
jgi:hypothetical protein